jgi:hypothetical protein
MPDGTALTAIGCREVRTQPPQETRAPMRIGAAMAVAVVGMWPYGEANTFGEQGQPDWERVLADCCGSSTAGPIAPNHISATGPALVISFRS